MLTLENLKRIVMFIQQAKFLEVNYLDVYDKD